MGNPQHLALPVERASPPDLGWARSTELVSLVNAAFDGYRVAFAMAQRLGSRSHRHQAARLLECAELCRLLAESGLRGSAHVLLLARVCEDACRICASICRQYDEAPAAECTELCCACVRACEALGSAG